MTQEQAYQLALSAYQAGLRGEPMPKVAPEHEAVLRGAWEQARKRAQE